MLKFTFNNKNSFDDMDCVIIGTVDYPIFNEEYEFIEVIGRKQGSLTKKTNNYYDKILTLNLRLIKINDLEARKEKIFKWLMDIENNKLFFSNNENKSYIIKQAEITKFIPFKNTQVDFTIQFTCEPFLRNTIEDELILENGGAIINDGYEVSNPIIKFNSTTSQNIHLTIGDSTFIVYNALGNVVIDSGLFIVKNEIELLKSSGEFPTLPLGESSINWVGEIEGFSVIPNFIYRG